MQRAQLPPPAASRVYELTEEGRGLAPAMTELSRWGVTRMGDPRPRDDFRPAWAMFPLSYMANSEAARGIEEVYEFRIDEETFHLIVEDAHRAVVVFTMDGRTIFDLLAGKVSPEEALSGGRVRFEGPPEAVGHALAILAGDAGT